MRKDKLTAHIDILTAGVKAQHEKLIENLHKEPITILDLDESIHHLKVELLELQEELDEQDRNLEAIRLELADCANFIHAAIFAIDNDLKE